LWWINHLLRAVLRVNPEACAIALDQIGGYDLLTGRSRMF
jgi:hypothetical protein